MRNQRFNTLFVVVLCLGGLPVGLWAQEDVNTPWDPAERFAPFWESVELSARLYNPAERPESDPNTQRQLTVFAGARILDKTGLIGFRRSPPEIVAADQDGTEIYRTTWSPHSSRWYSSIDEAGRFIGPGKRADELWTPLTVPIEAEQGNPLSLSRLEWTVGVLAADAYEVIDIPFEPNEAWVELVPGLEIMVAEASVEEGRYRYRIEAIYDRNVVSYESGAWRLGSDEVPATMLVKMEMVNADGEWVDDASMSGSFSGQGDLMIAKIYGSGSCSACGDVAIIRHTFALAAYELEARFVLENVPVPGF